MIKWIASNKENIEKYLIEDIAECKNGKQISLNCGYVFLTSSFDIISWQSFCKDIIFDGQSIFACGHNHRLKITHFVIFDEYEKKALPKVK
jgi:hypothetical protein